MNRDLSPVLARTKAILFDVDGTLADTVPMILAGLGDAYEIFLGSRPDDAVLRTLIGRSLVDQMNLFGLGESDPDGVRDRVAYAMDRMRHHKAGCRLFEPMQQALELACRVGLQTALVTSKNREELDEFLAAFPALSIVTTTVSADDSARPKPAPDPFLKACERLGVHPSEAIVIGDSPFDLGGARDAGIPSIGVTFGAAKRDELTEYGALDLLDDPADLLHALEEAFQTHQHGTNQKD